MNKLHVLFWYRTFFSDLTYSYKSTGVSCKNDSIKDFPEANGGVIDHLSTFSSQITYPLFA